MRLCRDEDCPKCGWGETYSEVRDEPPIGPVVIGCNKCGWREEAKRICFYIIEGQMDDGQYVPSVVTENEAGHTPMMGRDEFASPWHWGATREEADDACGKANAEMGLTSEDVTHIVASSMAAG